MNPCDLANIRNLTGLWGQMGASATDLDGGLVLHRSDAWPHRRWLDPGVPLDDRRVRAVSAALATDDGAVLTLWDGPSANQAARLRAGGLAVGFELLAMQRPRDEALPAGARDVGLDPVRAGADVELWTQVASDSFGYSVDEPVVRRLVGAPGVQLLLARHGGETVGTALLFEDAHAVGIHMLGVLPAHRRRGHARRVMGGLLQRARASRAPLVTLQASAAGEPLYASLGFERRFAIPHWSHVATDVRAGART